MSNPSLNQSWKFLLEEIKKKFEDIEVINKKEVSKEEKSKLYSLLKGQIDLMVDDFIRISEKIKLKEETNFSIVNINISDERKNEIKKTIYELNTFFSSYLSAIQDIEDRDTLKWYGDLFNKRYDFFETATLQDIFNHNMWKNLPIISELEYITAPSIERFLSDTVEVVPGGINYSSNNIWELDLGTVNQFIKKFGSGSIELQNCIAMYIVHEALHKKIHRLDRFTVEGIGDFSRVIEEADYQADVYAIINILLFRLKGIDNRQAKSQVLDLAINLVSTALDTTYAFARLEGNPPYKRSQIRRVNRTLIWIYQLIKLEDVKKSNESMHFKFVFEILSNKPIIDISGFEIFTSNNRVFYKLDTDNAGQLEIATFKENSIYRNEPNRVDFQNKLIEGLQNLDKEKLKEGMTSYLRRAGIL